MHTATFEEKKEAEFIGHAKWYADLYPEMVEYWKKQLTKGDKQAKRFLDALAK